MVAERKAKYLHTQSCDDFDRGCNSKVEKRDDRTSAKLEIELPIPMPSWNRLIAMHFWERKKCRDLIHAFVLHFCTPENESLTLITYQGKPRSMVWLQQAYLGTIRPSTSRKSRTSKRSAKKAKRKAPKSSWKR